MPLSKSNRIIVFVVQKLLPKIPNFKNNQCYKKENYMVSELATVTMISVAWNHVSEEIVQVLAMMLVLN